MWAQTEILATGLLGTSIAMFVLWLLQLRTGNAGVVDAAWALSIAGLAILSATLAHGWSERRLAIAIVMGEPAYGIGSSTRDWPTSAVWPDNTSEPSPNVKSTPRLSSLATIAA